MYILLCLFSNFNTLMTDGFIEEDSGNVGQLYSLWLLHHYGSEWRKLIYYASDYYTALDFTGDREAYMYRTFERLFRVIGLCEIREVRTNSARFITYVEARKTPLLDMMFSFEEPAKI